jgi:hypothetical protein
LKATQEMEQHLSFLYPAGVKVRRVKMTLIQRRVEECDNYKIRQR